MNSVIKNIIATTFLVIYVVFFLLGVYLSWDLLLQNVSDQTLSEETFLLGMVLLVVLVITVITFGITKIIKKEKIQFHLWMLVPIIAYSVIYIYFRF